MFLNYKTAQSGFCLKKQYQKGGTGISNATFNKIEENLLDFPAQLIRFPPFEPDFHFVSNNVHCRNKEQG